MFYEAPVMADKKKTALVCGQQPFQDLDGLDVQMACRFIQQQEFGLLQDAAYHRCPHKFTWGKLIKALNYLVSTQEGRAKMLANYGLVTTVGEVVDQGRFAEKTGQALGQVAHIDAIVDIYLARDRS